MKTTYRKSWTVNLWQMLTLTLDPCFKVKWGHTSPLLLVPDLQHVKTTFGKSKLTNLSQVSNFSFGLCFKVKWGQHSNKTLYLLTVGSRTSKCENNLQGIIACEVFVILEFDLGPLHQGQMGLS